MPIIVKRTESVPIKSVKTYDQNPRIGNIDLIAESLDTSGQFKPIVVNERTGMILAGNHTYLAARKLGWKDIYASYVDVDDETAKRIVLADNKTADAGEYDDTVLAELLASLPSIAGTGYTDIEVDELLKDINVDGLLEGVTASIEQEQRLQDEFLQSQTFEGAPLGEEPDLRQQELPPMPEDKAQELVRSQGPTIEDQSSNVGMVAFVPPDLLAIEGIGEWEIAKLREDMLMTYDELPEKLDSWAGSATKDWPDDEQWWLYNWGIDSTSGMKDISKVIVAFYAFDNYFENWWAYPERYAGKLVNSGIKYMVTPDFSMEYNMPKVEWLWQLHRSRQIGRYVQECGIKIIPNVTWVGGVENTFLEDVVLPTLPHGLPLIAMQMQTIGAETKADPTHYVKEIQTVFDTLEPEGALIYASAAGREIFKRVDTRGAKVRIIGNRLEKLSAAQKERKKKLTI